MSSFWTNVLQLLRFFLSSITGLIIMITKPVTYLYNKPLKFSYLSLILVITFLLYKTLMQMLGINSAVVI
uniref:Uncharacterized protein ycf33 n=1 Tax=Boldia erythrosiphon TaxID=74908 RepID=A0A1Y9TLN7_9RHOD|nr:conserved hypothetical plastid protein [Boldia erythrosiphon]ARO90525.1 conserved hypothetical plastid protein [Boldia erythrosiphon]